MERNQEPTWYPISALGLIGSLIDGQLDACQDQYQTLLEVKDRPYVLDDATVARLTKVYGETAEDLWVSDEQLARWSKENLTPAQRQEVQHLEHQILLLHEAVEAILTFAAGLKGRTIEALLAKSDLEVGLEWLLGDTDH